MQPIEPSAPSKSSLLDEFDQKTQVAHPSERLSHAYEPALFRKVHRLDESDGIELENPTDRVLSCICHLHSPKPTFNSDRWDDEPSERQIAAARAAQIASAVKITFQPHERKWIPRTLVPALVTLRDGVVTGGQLHVLRVPGEHIPIHPSLLGPDDEALPFAVPR